MMRAFVFTCGGGGHMYRALAAVSGVRPSSAALPPRPLGCSSWLPVRGFCDCVGPCRRPRFLHHGHFLKERSQEQEKWHKKGERGRDIFSPEALPDIVVVGDKGAAGPLKVDVISGVGLGVLSLDAPHSASTPPSPSHLLLPHKQTSVTAHTHTAYTPTAKRAPHSHHEPSSSPSPIVMVPSSCTADHIGCSPVGQLGVVRYIPTTQGTKSRGSPCRTG